MTANDPTDQRRFAELVDRYLDRVYRYLRNLTRDPEAARDLAHETFLKLRQRGFGDGLPSEAYVFTAARNTALSAWRKRRRESAHIVPLGNADPWHDGTDDPVERGELRVALETALGRLPEDQRTVFLLSHLEGLKYDQISEVLGIPAGTVASRKHAAVGNLRDLLERSGHALPRVS